eukprot:3697445-Amphidinium_carterae.1
MATKKTTEKPMRSKSRSQNRKVLNFQLLHSDTGKLSRPPLLRSSIIGGLPDTNVGKDEASKA